MNKTLRRRVHHAIHEYFAWIVSMSRNETLGVVATDADQHHEAALDGTHQLPVDCTA